MIIPFKRSLHAPAVAGVKTRENPAFSLVEVVVAVGIFALGIVGVLGLLSPSIKSVSEVADTAVANRLADNIQVELERLGFSAVISATGTSSITLVASKDGSRVLRANGVTPIPADQDTAIGTPPGILHRDRYYGITVSRFPATNSDGTPNALAYTSGSGFIALSVRVVWPYEIPSGPDLGATKPTSESNYQTANSTQQSVMLLNMALRP